MNVGELCGCSFDYICCGRKTTSHFPILSLLFLDGKGASSVQAEELGSTIQNYNTEVHL
jgi:hypothetical protein